MKMMNERIVSYSDFVHIHKNIRYATLTSYNLCDEDPQVI
jgi:hypothetical protein